MVQQFDFLVIGSGIAGMSLALKVADKGKVAIICKTELEEANTYFAQGGIASVTNLLVDNFDKHIEDTMIAGDWINDREAVEMVVRGAPDQIKELISWGVNFDKKGERRVRSSPRRRAFRIPHPTSQGQHRRRDPTKPYRSDQETSQHHDIQPSLCSRDHHAASLGYHRHPSYAGHQMLRRLCAERRHR